MPNETREEKKLNSELVKLIKQANQRILRLERETGLKGSFGIKQLYDYLGVPYIDAITKQGRIKRTKEYTTMQEIALKKAIENFIHEGSSLKEIKAFVNKYSNLAGKKLTYEMASNYYQVIHTFEQWLYTEKFTKSEFWKIWVPLAKTMDKSTWVDSLIKHRGEIVDRKMRKDIEILYDYVKGE